MRMDEDDLNRKLRGMVRLHGERAGETNNETPTRE
jgi:hypothetical protein